MIVKIILILVIFLNLLLSVFVLSQNPRSTNNRLFSLIGLLAGIWTFSTLMIVNMPNSLMWFETAYAFGSQVMAAGLIWVLLLTNNQLKRNKVTLITTIAFLFFSASYIPGFIINNSNQIYSKAIFTETPSWGLTFYTIYYLVISFLILFKLLSAHHQTNDPERKYQLKYIFLGSLTTLFISALSSFILPHFGIFLFAGIDSIGFLIFLIAIAYSITRHHLFNIKLIAIEFITFALWIIMLVRIILAQNTQEMLIESGLLIITIIFGILLIRTSLREMRQKEELEDLNQNLEQKVAEQTHEVKRAYELEKKAKRELEKLNETKDQFIMITQHNLRTPVTSIRWELESMLSGAHGELSADLRKTLEDTSGSVDTLTRIVDDFLNITALKVGSQILNLAPGNMKPLLQDVIRELRIDIENMHLTIDYPEDEKSWPIIQMDSNKMREVLLIVIENAVRYNINEGSINILTDTENGIFKITVENTGVGITSEDRGNLFERLFYRSKKAQITHPGGMGIGLSVSRAIVRAHHGNITIHSEGESKGATVTITLPLDFLKNI